MENICAANVSVHGNRTSNLAPKLVFVQKHTLKTINNLYHIEVPLFSIFLIRTEVTLMEAILKGKEGDCVVTQKKNKYIKKFCHDGESDH